MIRQVSAVAAVGLLASGCSSVPFVHKPSAQTPPAMPRPLDSSAHCAPNSPCAPKEKSAKRQYFDIRHQRYYYYDPLTRSYYWEDGQPKR
jgi:hypothetical protein